MKMKKHITIATKIYGPILLAVALFLLAISIKRGQNLGYIELNPTFLGISIFKCDLPIANTWVARGLLVCISLGTLSLPLFLDYSAFFPRHLEMEVFFDNEGILESLKIFSAQELKQVRVPDNFQEFQSRYYDDVNAEIRKMFQTEEDFYLDPSQVHSQGHCFTVAEKLFGLQRYHIRESYGEVVNVVERPSKPALQVKSFFEKLNSHHDYINPPLRQLLIRRNFIVQPRFKQIFAANLKAEGTSFHHTLVGLFKVTFFPLPKFSNTIYMMELDDVGLIPVAYAIFRNS